jgi:hypothetical protein
MSREEAGGNSGLLHKETRMSREDDFFGDFNESPDDVDTGQEDTSEPMMEEPDETEPAPASEPARPTAPKARPKAKKKPAGKPKVTAKKTAKKKVSKTVRKPAAKKTAKKKTTTAKKKKSARPKK